MSLNITPTSSDYDALWKEMPEARNVLVRIALSRRVKELEEENSRLRAEINGELQEEESDG